MGLAETAHKLSPVSRLLIDVKELEYIAFSGQHEMAHGIFRSIPKEDRSRYANKYILSEVITGGVKKLRKFLAASAEGPAADEKDFIDGTVRLFISTARQNNIHPRELFQSILNWSEELTRLSLLQFALPEQTHVDLSVYNLNGQLVTRLANDVRSPGDYEVRWDARDLASGIYFVRLSTAAFNRTQKVMLLK